jgi:hypothetical protein
MLPEDSKEDELDSEFADAIQVPAFLGINNIC